jgi:hypothetical protein
MSRVVRRLHFYEVQEAGGQIGLKRSGSYTAAKAGLIPTERHGKFLLVPKRKWDRQVKRLLRRQLGRGRDLRANGK